MSQYPPQASGPPGSYGSMRPHRGALILVLGILGLLLCVILGIIAWVMGNGDLRQMDAGVMDPAGRGLTQAGRILGMISCILAILGIGIGVIIMVLTVIGAAASGGP
ncbi:MAG: hypothetical protein KJZ69_01235 [Phycisphaerales bacterium]|nr:hypothetical protein [Phycisphaerales bacterium]